MKTHFFSRQAIPTFFLHYTPNTLVILHTEFSLIWITPWPDEKELFLKFAKIRNWRNSQNSVWKPIFFLGKLCQKLLLYTLITLVIMHTEFGLFWTTPCPDEKELFFKILKIRTSRNSQISVWKPNFFPRQAKPNTLFALHFHYTGDTPYRIWFDLGNSMTRWKRIFFKIRKNSQFEKFAKFRMKTHFILGKLYQQLFCITLSLHWWYSIPSLVWFGQLLNPMKETYF